VPRPTPAGRGVKMIAYTTRNLRADLRDRLRVQATLLRTTMEDIVNRALSLGLEELEGRDAPRDSP